MTFSGKISQKFWRGMLMCSILLLAAGCQAAPQVISDPLIVTPQNTPSRSTPAIAATCTESGGTTQPQSFHSALMGSVFNFRVHLPPCYSPEPATPYPVLYLLHGQTYSSDQWERLGAVEAADGLIASGVSMPFMIIMPEETDTRLEPDDILFGEALVEELIPWVEARYPVCRERTCRALGGLSRGAAWAMRVGLTHPGLFSVLGAHSLPPFLRDLYDLPGWLTAIPLTRLPTIYMDSGRQDLWLADALMFEEILTQHAIPHEWYYNTGGHDETYWLAHTPTYINWYAAQIANMPE